MIDVIQLNKDIQASRLLTMAYNERVLSGVISLSEHYEHAQHHKELTARAAQWRDETRHLFTAHGKMKRD